mmetsp:Transcript_33598/g.86861  ORF Transcript_33598/g.86861 Transcript_33598/m.86861 type:complete len:274 (+) Transcript_33598:405-1226(+)
MAVADFARALPRSHPTVDSPEIQAAIAQAGSSDEFMRVLEALTGSGQRVGPGAAGPCLRGARVANPEPAFLQALQNMLGWTLGYETRPTPETRALKERDRLGILLKYRQPEDPGNPPTVAMLDYLVDTLFGVPMRPVGPEVVAPQYQNLEGEIVTPTWVEADWARFRAEVAATRRPETKFMPNRYPYILPERPGATELQRRAQHSILWYFNTPEEPLNDPGDAQIERDLRAAVAREAQARRLPGIDYIWYRNPCMSAPDVFHVQVFWIVPVES